jgi:hypothetical protein
LGLTRFNYPAGTAILTDGFPAIFFWRSLMSQSRIPISKAMADDTIAKYLNDYRCPDCLLEWQDEKEMALLSGALTRWCSQNTNVLSKR